MRYCHFGVSPVNYSDYDSDNYSVFYQNIFRFNLGVAFLKSVSIIRIEFNRCIW